jgi:hypothetical protein
MGAEMIKMRQRKLIFALLVILPIFAGCKSESPTAPPPTTGGAPTGGVTPPVGASITLTVSNASPVVNSTSTITATVTVNNQPVPNGTAVEYSTNLGTFTDTGTNTTVKITNGGTASAILTSGTAGTATVIVTVNNSNKSTTITFGASGNPTPGGPPTITSVTPNFGLPTGGQQVTINGTNFRTPLRVLFDPGSGQAAKEAFVVSSTSTQIVVVTPAVDLGTGQTLPVTVTVITQAGTTSEQSVSLPTAFTFQAAVLTPSIRAVQPTSGPISGGTRVTIFGDAFQAPLVQVFFGAAEAQVISTNFSQLVVMSPRASDTAPGGSGVVTGPVNIRVLNVASGKDASLSGGFRYIPKMVITTFGPGEGPSTGGTRVTIDGVGFDDPLAVGIAGIAAQVIKVSGSEVLAITSPVQVVGCANVTGPIVVANTENGDSASTGSTIFTYRIAKPAIISVSPATLGGTTTIVVLNAQGVARIIIGGVQASIVSQTVNPDGTTTFVVQVPASLKLDTLACPGVSGANAPQPTAFDVTYLSATTGCTDTAVKALIVSPPGGPVITLVPPSFAPFVGVITPPVPPSVTPTVVVTPSSQTVNVVNTGNGPLMITAVTETAAGGTGCARFTVSTGGLPATLNQCDIFPINASYNAPTVPTPVPDQCNVTLTTNAGTRTLTLIGSSH